MISGLSFFLGKQNDLVLVLLILGSSLVLEAASDFLCPLKLFLKTDLLDRDVIVSHISAGLLLLNL